MSKVKQFLIALAILWPVTAHAQLNVANAKPSGIIPLYQHPEVAQYNSPADWPLLDSQGHWCPGGATNNGQLVPCYTTPDDPFARDQRRLSHLHVGCQAPAWGIVTDELAFPCRLMLFQSAGQLVEMAIGWSSVLNDTSIWDNTGTNNPGPIVGDPAGLVVRTFTVRVPPAYWATQARGPNAHGANSFVISAKILFDNGDSQRVTLEIPFFIAVDTTQPLKLYVPNTNSANYHLTPLVADSQPTSVQEHAISHELAIGGASIRVNDYLPLPTGPLSAPRDIHVEIGRYSDPALAKGISSFFAELRADVNLHAYNEGTLIERQTNTQDRLDPLRVVNISRAFTIPVGLAVGKHNAMLRWSTQAKDANEIMPGNEEMQTLLTFPFLVGDGTTPPPPPPDTDGDGVKDADDHCPGTAAGVNVDAMGCPIIAPPPPPVDTDGDGVNDPDDKCPTVAGPASNAGCPIIVPNPDTDGDGLPDNMDKCPTQAGPRENGGCPVVVPPPPDPNAAAKAKLAEVEAAYNDLGAKYAALGALIAALRLIIGG